MEPVTYVASATVSSTDALTVSVGFDIFAVIGHMFDGGTGISSSGFFEFLKSLWTVYAILAYLLCIFMLGLYVFASIRRNLYVGLLTQGLRDQEQMYEELYGEGVKNSRLKDVFTHTESDNPNDWKLAIIEADIILDEILKQKGYVGNSLGERLRNIQPQQLNSLDDAWEAHKVRNRIAHDGADFVLTKRMVHETISRYQRVFSEFGIT